MNNMNFWNTNKGRQLKSNAANKRKEEYGKKYPDLIVKLNKLNDMGKLYGFVKDMHKVLTIGSRKFTENMYKITLDILEKPEFDEIKMVEQKAKAKVLIEKVNKVYDLVMEVDERKHSFYQANYSAIPFVRSIKDQVNKKYWLSKKQMEALNKVYKKYLKRKEKLDGRKNNK